MVRYYVVFSGLVQGVGFRYSLIKLARQYNLTGWVRNRYDEKVEAQIQGEYSNIIYVINHLEYDTEELRKRDNVILTDEKIIKVYKNKYM